MNKTANPKSGSVADLKARITLHLDFTLGADRLSAQKSSWWKATCLAINELVCERLNETHRKHAKHDTRAVSYLSLEFLMGRLLSNNLHNLQVFETASQALGELGFDIDELCEEEPDMALGNGGLGRLAACYLDSLATLNYPAIGYGIHYEHGLFRQEFHRGRQVERPDEWREYGSPWEICRPESVQNVSLFGHVETITNEAGVQSKRWHPGQVIKGVPWDVPIVGYGAETVNILRLWESRASQFFDWDAFNAGAYQDAQKEQNQAETVSKVLYPNDDTDAGKQLRLIQQYFFCACSVKDIVRRYKRAHKTDWSRFSDLVVIQLNDTHPTLAIVELMRLLLDEEGLAWDQAWQMCREVFAYTNHTLLPEALETWSLDLFARVLPRHLEIIYDINAHFLNGEVEQMWPGDDAMKRKLSIIEEGDNRRLRMANLCVICAFKVNGVAQVHSELVKRDLFPEFNALWPNKLTNVTNGVTPRRWLKVCNPRLANLLTEKVGSDWPENLTHLESFSAFADDSVLQQEFMAIKHQNKVDLAAVVKQLTDVDVDPGAIFDVQIKRLHEYKRQHLNLLHILALYRRLIENPNYDMHPRVFLFGAKAAPGYHLAKDIIYALNKISERVNNDQGIQGKLKVVFLPNYRVSLAEKMIPAADISEQISTAGKEASGTGNMKLALNGAVTVGTLDGANVEIAEEVGEDNIFIFGLTIDEVQALEHSGYQPWDYYHANPEIKACLDWLDSDYFTPGNPGELSSIKHSLLDGGDPYRVLADFAAYSDVQVQADRAYGDKSRWAKMAMMNTAMMGKFTSDRSVQDYVRDIWKLDTCDE